VGFPAGWARFAYGVAPLPIEAAIGAVARRAMDRASIAPRTEGTVMRPDPEGRRASGGWLDRPGTVEARRAGNVALLAAGAALAFGTLAWASRRARV
jgi:hypothetical protein